MPTLSSSAHNTNKQKKKELLRCPCFLILSVRVCSPRFRLSQAVYNQRSKVIKKSPILPIPFCFYLFVSTDLTMKAGSSAIRSAAPTMDQQRKATMTSYLPSTVQCTRRRSLSSRNPPRRNTTATTAIKDINIPHYD